jgi:hypothetical protein
MASIKVVPSQIWQDDCYYLDTVTGECKRKYVLVLAVEMKSGDSVTAVFTTKSNGLPETPACFLGPPRAGYFCGIPGGNLGQESWVDFSSVVTLDNADLAAHVKANRTKLLAQTLAPETFCAVLRCVLRTNDITMRQARWIGDAVAALGCP